MLMLRCKSEATAAWDMPARNHINNDTNDNNNDHTNNTHTSTKTIKRTYPYLNTDIALDIISGDSGVDHVRARLVCRQRWQQPSAERRSETLLYQVTQTEVNPYQNSRCARCI